MVLSGGGRGPPGGPEGGVGLDININQNYQHINININININIKNIPVWSTSRRGRRGRRPPRVLFLGAGGRGGGM